MVKVGKENECWDWQASCMRGGYGGFKYYPDQKDRNTRIQISAHRFSYILANGDIQDSLLVCHDCDNPKCCNPKHLFVGTQKDNMADRAKKGRYINGGVNNPRAILNKEKVREIKKLISAKKSNKEIALMYNVVSSTIWQIRVGNNWADV